MKKYLKISIFNLALLSFALLLFAYTFLSATFLKPDDTFAAETAATSTDVQVQASAATSIDCATQVGTGYSQTTVKGLCGSVTACVNTTTAKTGECDFMGTGTRDCGTIKPAAAVGFTWSCYANRCVQEESKSCLIKSGNSCITCGCTETTPAAIAAKTAQCVNGATSYSTRCANCGNAVTYACPKTYTCNVCDKSTDTWVVKSTTGSTPCDEVTSFADKAKALAACVHPVTYNCNYCDKTTGKVTSETSTTACKTGSYPTADAAKKACTPNVCNYCDLKSGTVTTETTYEACKSGNYATADEAKKACTPVPVTCNKCAVVNGVNVNTSKTFDGVCPTDWSTTPLKCENTCSYCDKTDANNWVIKSDMKTYNVACDVTKGQYSTPDKVPACVTPKLDLTILKVVDKPVVAKDDKPVFTITVSNSGNVVVPGPIVISDVLPKGLTYVSTSSVGNAWTCASAVAATGETNLNCKNPAGVAVGQKLVDLNITTQATEYDKTYINKADTYSENVPGGNVGETNPNNNHSEATVKTNPQPELPLACVTNPSSPTGYVVAGTKFDVVLGSASNSKTPGTLVSDTPVVCTVSGTKVNFITAGTCKYHVVWDKAEGNVKPDQVTCPGTAVNVLTPIIPGVSTTKEMNASGANFANYSLKVANTGNVTLKSVKVNDYFDSEHLKIDSIKIGETTPTYNLVDVSTEQKKSTEIVFTNLADIPSGGMLTIALNFKVVGEVEVATLACNTKVESSVSYADYAGTMKILNDSYVNPITNTLCVTIPAIKYDNMYLSVTKTNVTGTTVRIGTQEKPTQVTWLMKVQALCSGRCKPITKVSFSDTYPNDYLYLENLTMQKFNSDGTAASDIVEIYKDGVQKLTLTTIVSNLDTTTRNMTLLIDNLLISTLGGSMTPGQYVQLNMVTDTKKVGTNIVNTVVATGPNDSPHANAIVNVEGGSVIGISVEALPDTNGFMPMFLDFSNPANEIAFTIATLALVFGLGAAGLMIIEKRKIPNFQEFRRK